MNREKEARITKTTYWVNMYTIHSENIVTLSVGQMTFEIARHINLIVTVCKVLTNGVIIRRPRNVHTFILRYSLCKAGSDKPSTSLTCASIQG
jgi:hypothetical protein